MAKYFVEFDDTARKDLKAHPKSGNKTQKDRIVYRVEEDVVIVYVVSAMGHYSDK
ncbi:MAG: hypothetical protein ABI850_15675 [Flavobacterium sp.]